MNAPEEVEEDCKEDILEVVPSKRLNVIVHDAHFIGGESFNQRWCFALAVYQLRRQPTDLLELLEGCAPGPSRPKLVQWTEHALIYLLPPDNGLYWSDERQYYRHKVSFNISTGRSSGKETKVYNIHIMGTSPSVTTEALLKLLRYPIKQQMLTIELDIRSDIITPSILQQIVCECGGPFREYLFSHVALSSDECYRLARNASKLVFHECIFLDSGAAFLRGVQERVTPLSLAFLGRDRPVPNLVPILLDAKLCELELREGFPLSLSECHALADAQIERLVLEKSRLEDHGKSLLTAIAGGKGPLHLQLNHWDDRKQRDDWLVHALCSKQCQLQSLCLTGSQDLPDESSWQMVLQAILVGNNALRSFELDSFHLTNELWDIFLDVLGHPCTTIRRLSLQNMGLAGHHQDGCMARSRRLAEIVQTNRNMEEIQGDCVPLLFDAVIWNTQITPCVLDNRYRNRFRQLQRDRNGGALLAHALAYPELQDENSWYAFLLLESSVNLWTTL